MHLKKSNSFFIEQNKDHIKTAFSTYNNNLLKHNNRKVFPQKYKSSIEFDSNSYIKTTYNSMNRTTKNQYDYKTQIVTLPGGIKREDSEIKDDIRPLSPKLGTAYSLKMNQLYKSKINCLPGTEKNTEKEPKNIHMYKNKSNSLFYNKGSRNEDNIQTIYKRNVNSFNVSLKKQIPASRNQIFNVIHQEKLVTTYKYYKNKSQINIL